VTGRLGDWETGRDLPGSERPGIVCEGEGEKGRKILDFGFRILN